jgi:predicted dehydrogenase
MPIDPHLSRRQFLAAPAALAAPQSSPPSDRIRLGVIGLGPRGRYVLGHFLKEDDIQVVAVCDAAEERRNEAKQMVDQRYANTACLTYRQHEQILARQDIDAVLIATGDRWHGVLSALAAKAGKDVYCEKPFTLTIAEGRELADTIRRYGTIWQCGMQRRSDPGYQFVCEVIKAGRIGRLSAITLSFGEFGGGRVGLPVPEPTPNLERFDYDRWLGQSPWMPYSKIASSSSWRVNWDLSGGVIADMGPHFVQIAQWIRGGNPGPIDFSGDAAFHSEAEYNATPYFLSVRARYPDRFTLMMDMQPKAMRFDGSQGWIKLSDVDGKVELSSPELTRGIERQQSPWKVMKPHIRNFLDCVRSRQEPVTGVEVAQAAHNVAHAANLCLRLERPLRWNPENESFAGDDEANRMRARSMRVPWRI